MTAPHTFADETVPTHTDLNNGIPRITTGTSAPSSPLDGDWWIDTTASTAPVLKEYNATDTAWYEVTT